MASVRRRTVNEMILGVVQLINLDICVFLTFLLLQATGLPTVHDYCLEETLEIQCAADEIILIESARYGRMRINRCARTDYGYIGCGADVTRVLAGKCSGRRQCRIGNMEALFASHRACPTDLKSFVEASYRCIKVVMPDSSVSCHQRAQSVHSGHDDGFMATHLPTAGGSSGVIASYTSRDLGVGTTVACPWLITAQPGQRINITLMDFSDKIPVSGGGSLVGSRQAVGSDPTCREYAVIAEGATYKDIVVCGQSARTRSIYSSKMNRLKVSLIAAGNAPDDDGPYFALRYEVYGCAYPSLPHNVYVASASEDLMTVKCNSTSESWTLRCVDDTWVGLIGNCTFIEQKKLASAINNEEDFLPYGLSLMVIFVVASSICVITLAIGLAYLHRNRTYQARQNFLKNFDDKPSPGTTILFPVTREPVPYSPNHASTLPRLTPRERLPWRQNGAFPTPEEVPADFRLTPGIWNQTGDQPEPGMLARCTCTLRRAPTSPCSPTQFTDVNVSQNKTSPSHVISSASAGTMFTTFKPTGVGQTDLTYPTYDLPYSGDGGPEAILSQRGPAASVVESWRQQSRVAKANVAVSTE